jgi:hypothetical protein
VFLLKCYLYGLLLFVSDIGFSKLMIEVFKVTALQCKLKFVKRMKGQTPFTVCSMYLSMGVCYLQQSCLPERNLQYFIAY